MNFLITVCNMMNPNISNSALKGELFSYTEPILNAISDKLGDNLVKVRTLAEDSLIAMAEHQAFGLQPCLSMLYRSTAPNPQDSKKDKKTMQSNKHIQGRYQALLRILSQFEVKDPSLVKGAVAFALKGIQHNLQDVRNVAYKCMSELYRLVGPNIR
jgi:hypothetical protein